MSLRYPNSGHMFVYACFFFDGSFFARAYGEEHFGVARVRSVIVALHAHCVV